MTDTSLENLNEKLDSIISGVKEAQKIGDRNSERLDVLDKEQISRISEDVTKAMDDVQKIREEQKKDREEQNKIKEEQADLKNVNATLEKILCKLPNAGKSTSEESIEEKNEFIAYLRKNKTISENVWMGICEDIVSKSFYGISEQEKQMHIKRMAEGDNTDGGYWMRPEISQMIISRVFETSPLRLVANIENTSSESLEFIIDDNEVDAGWVGEVTARPETATAKIGKLVIHAHEVYANPAVTQRLLDDAGFDLETWLARKVADKFGRLENTAFVVGDGAQKPRGFLTYPAWAAAGVYERKKIEQINSGSSGAFEGDGVIKMQNALKEDYQANAVWGIKRAAFEGILLLKDGEDRYLLFQNGDLRSSAEKILLGKPVIFMEDMPAIAADSLSLVYADFKLAYTIVDRIGIRVLRDPYTSKPEVLFYTTKRTGGDVTNYDAIKIQKLAV